MEPFFLPTRYRLEQVPTEQVSGAWHVIGHYFEASCRRGSGDITPDDIRAKLLKGGACLLLILAEDNRVFGALAVEFRDMAHGQKSCLILGLGGEGVKEWIHLIRDLERGARDLGATSIKFMGRIGWSRLLPDDYHVEQMVYSKDLRH